MTTKTPEEGGGESRMPMDVPMEEVEEEVSKAGSEEKSCSESLSKNPSPSSSQPSTETGVNGSSFQTMEVESAPLEQSKVCDSLEQGSETTPEPSAINENVASPASQTQPETSSSDPNPLPEENSMPEAVMETSSTEQDTSSSENAENKSLEDKTDSSSQLEKDPISQDTPETNPETTPETNPEEEPSTSTTSDTQLPEVEPEAPTGVIQISSVSSLNHTTDLFSSEEITTAPAKESDQSRDIPIEDPNGGFSSLASSPRSNTSGSNNSSAPPPVKKVGLKLASFAGLGQNGIADTTPISGHGRVSVCKACSKEIDGNFGSILIWETMQFCGESCLKNYQVDYNECSSCKKTVSTTSVGKYCVRFGSDIKQFCSNVCLESYKKGLKVCCYCQKDISGGEGFLAPTGGKGQFKDFCLQSCLKRYEALHLGKEVKKDVLSCAVCSEIRPVEVELLVKSTNAPTTKREVVKLCSNPCFSAFKFANSLDTSNCDFCSMPYDIHASDHVIYYGNLCKRFCSISCQNVYVMKYRRIVPCQWCKVKKYNFDMVEKLNAKVGSNSLVYCSVNCLNLHGFTRKADNVNSSNWNGSTRPPAKSTTAMPVIQSVSSLADAPPPSMFPESIPPPELLPSSNVSQGGGVKEIIKEYIIKCPEDVQVRNMATLTKPYMQTKGVSCRPNTSSKSTQTEAPPPNCLFPVAVPLYMPVPLRMYAAPYPVPIPVPIPIPVPVFMPIKRNSLEGVMKTISKIHSKLPSDPFEAELLAMAGAIADKALLDSDSEDDILLSGKESKNKDKESSKDDVSEDITTSSSLMEQPASSTSIPPEVVEDLEKDILADKVVPKSLPAPAVANASDTSSPSSHNNNTAFPSAGRTRSGLKRRTSRDIDESPVKEVSPAPPRPKPKAPRGRPPKNKQSRIDSSVPVSSSSTTITTSTSSSSCIVANNSSTPTDSRSNTPVASMSSASKERPDSKHHLKYTYGVNAWKHWVIKKNAAEVEKGESEGKYLKTFETDLLKLRADELNFTLCMFVKEVKKPNGDSYAPDSVLYLTLGIQEYLFENGRIDNIFTDTYYETFTSTLHEVVKDFKLPVNELGYFVTRIEEEHLWESKQLGCHTPQVLLNTLIYLNTKYFMLKTCDEHAKLSFNQIMKQWKKTMTPGTTNQERTVLLRYYPTSAPRKKSDDKKCYEQHENTENPARCPVKYYEQYMAKIPESAKTRSDVFYLQPEKSCVADSPLWFSNEQLSTHQLDKMLQRLLMVREIQEHMLADASSATSSSSS